MKGIIKNGLFKTEDWLAVWLALAFTSIGLETKFTELFKMGGGRPAIAFIGAQTFNVIWTLILAYLLFGGFIFKVPAIQ